MPLLLEHGINHIDTAASYGDAELRIAPWLRRAPRPLLPRHEDGTATYREARRTSGARSRGCGTDHVDLMQLHNLVDQREWDTAMGPRRRPGAAVEARDEGLVRFIGVTGHGLKAAAMHRRSLERFPFDSVLFPYNSCSYADPQYAADFRGAPRPAPGEGVAVQTIKAICLGPWGSSEATPRPGTSRSRSRTDIDLAVHWVLGSPDVFLNSVGDLRLLPAVLDAAERFEARPSNEQMAGLLEDRRLTSLFA